MTDADELLRKLERREHQKQAEAEARDRQRAVSALAALLQDVSAEAAKVLFQLARQDYPGMTGVTVQRPRWKLRGVVGYHTERVAGWEISRWARTPERRSGEIFLLSNARFVLSNVVGAGRELEVDDDVLLGRLELILDGLSHFHSHLERHAPILGDLTLEAETEDAGI